ncbi:MAG: lytic polysaccharide monooxygenase, partial [Ostreibacterium sp.]
MKNYVRNRSYIKIACLASLCGLGLSNVYAHAYIDGSRSYYCKVGGNTHCGAIMYEPQSLEAPQGFPQYGPKDGAIASAGHKRFGELDIQSADRWKKKPIKAGKNTFHWTYTMRHVTRGYDYYITKQDWNPNTALTRASFDLKPFCKTGPHLDSDDFICDVPQRTGYQV